MSKSHLISGGAGFSGINLLRCLLAKGECVATLDLAPFDYEELRERVRVVGGDIRHADTVAFAPKGVDRVIHTAAALPLYTPEEIFSTEIEGNALSYKHYSKAMLNGLSTSPRLPYMESSDHQLLLETDKVQGVGPYGEAKILAEGICEEYRAKGMYIPILRLKSFIGPERL